MFGGLLLGLVLLQTLLISSSLRKAQEIDCLQLTFYRGLLVWTGFTVNNAGLLISEGDARECWLTTHV